ncbi:MAG: host attachment protein [Gammaproteobacteria bacterium]|nr:host attachment protein [Gammaproteobacteria bacterium]
MQKGTWLVIANSVQANFYQLTHEDYKLLTTLEHEAGRLKTHDLVSDRTGHYRAGNTVRGAYGSTTDPHEEEHIVFAREVARYLETQRQEKSYNHIILCAASHFLGLLNKEMSKGVEEMIIEVIEKDYIPLPPKELDKIIQGMIF